VWDVGERNDLTPDAWRDVRLKGGRLLSTPSGENPLVAVDGVAAELGAEGTTGRRQLPAPAVCSCAMPAGGTALLLHDGALVKADDLAGLCTIGGPVRCASSAGTFLGVLAMDGECRVLDLEARPLAPEVMTSLSGATGVAVSRMGSVALWDASGTFLIRTGGKESRHDVARAARTQRAVWLPGDRALLLRNATREMLLVDVAKGAVVRTVRAHTAMVRSLAVDATGRWMVSGGADGQVRLWDLKGMVSTALVSGLENWVESLDIDSATGVVSCLLDNGSARRYRLPRPDLKSDVDTLARHVCAVVGLEEIDEE
jgi:hypothetical protein